MLGTLRSPLHVAVDLIPTAGTVIIILTCTGKKLEVGTLPNLLGNNCQ